MQSNQSDNLISSSSFNTKSNSTENQQKTQLFEFASSDDEQITKPKFDGDYPFRFEIETSLAIFWITFVLFLCFLNGYHPWNSQNYNYEAIYFVEPCEAATISVPDLIGLKQAAEALLEELGSLNKAAFALHTFNGTFDETAFLKQENVRTRYLSQAKILESHYKIFEKCYKSNVKNFYKNRYFEIGIYIFVYFCFASLMLFSAFHYNHESLKEVENPSSILFRWKLYVLKKQKQRCGINYVWVIVSTILHLFFGISAMLVFFFAGDIEDQFIQEFPL